jgi:hypothetical protein
MNECEKSGRHQSAVIVSEDWSRRVRTMSCQTCGSNWTESF